MPEHIEPTQLVPHVVARQILPLFRAERLPPSEPEIVVEQAAGTLHPSLVVLTEPAGRRAASFRALRHRLVERGDPRAVLVTSAVPGEGKTTVAANLALAIAEPRKYRVLLVEANTRSPSLAGRLGVDDGRSVCFLSQLELHRREPEAPWRVISVGPGELHVLAIGREGAPGIDAPSFAGAVDRLRASYDYVIVDGPPVLTGPEVSLLEDAVDSLVLAVRASQTRGRKLQAALEQILPAEVAGIVVVDG